MNSSVVNVKKLLSLLIILAFILALYEVGYGIFESQTTGTLIVSASSGSTITVTQSGKGYSNIGTGGARVRLKPGTYEVIASINRNQANKTVQITKKQKTSLTLNVAPTSVSQQVASSPAVISANQLISELLPYTAANNEYKINYFYKFTNNVAVPTITITYTDPAAPGEAIAWLNSLGFDTSQLNIQYIVGPVVN